MNEEFKKAGRGQNWVLWIGQPPIYDGGLCVNRTPEEHEESDKHRNVPLLNEVKPKKFRFIRDM